MGMIREFKAVLYERDKIFLRWGLAGKFVLGDVFELHRSLDPSFSDFTLVNASIPSTFYYDSGINLYSKFRNIYYRIKVKRLIGGVYVFVGEEERCSVFYEKDGILALEMQRKKKLYMGKKHKNYGKIFIKRTVGERCSRCYDDITMTTLDAFCPVCFGTTFDKGFYDPITINYLIGTSPKEALQPPISSVENRVLKVEMGNFPICDPKDLFVDRVGKIWRLENITTKELLKNVISQDLYVKELDYSEVEYTLKGLL